ncbi:hypothetical protein FNYG_14411 [Fusarium nygamai]|uniref:Uncharacterized protein n=1 Tax=Gibberella nygamai TaxID=42673 RepID=A0A2K0USV8_GIBNY|nr:hypothetical protein FNYG_14411 [Fusarium nygamai]
MNSNDLTENESVLGSGDMWSTPTTQCNPWAMHNCDAQSYSTVSYWDPSSVSFQQIPSETISRPGFMDQDLYPPTTTDESPWMENPAEVQFNLQGEGFNMGTNEAIPMLELKPGTLIYEDQMAIDDDSKPHCTSGSSFSTPTSSRSYDGSSPAVSGACYFSPSYSPSDNRTDLVNVRSSFPVAAQYLTAEPFGETLRTIAVGNDRLDYICQKSYYIPTHVLRIHRGNSGPNIDRYRVRGEILVGGLLVRAWAFHLAGFRFGFGLFSNLHLSSLQAAATATATMLFVTGLQNILAPKSRCIAISDENDTDPRRNNARRHETTSLSGLGNG